MDMEMVAIIPPVVHYFALNLLCFAALKDLVMIPRSRTKFILK